jgi:hypothetical protein
MILLFFGCSAIMYLILYGLSGPKTLDKPSARCSPMNESPMASSPSESFGGFSPCLIRYRIGFV